MNFKQIGLMIYNEVSIMNKKKQGFLYLKNIIGEAFFEKHKDSAVFSSQNIEEGLFCFLGIDLHPENTKLCLSASLQDWDIFATCIVKDNDIICSECRLPSER